MEDHAMQRERASIERKKKRKNGEMMAGIKMSDQRTDCRGRLKKRAKKREKRIFYQLQWQRRRQWWKYLLINSTWRRNTSWGENYNIKDREKNERDKCGIKWNFSSWIIQHQVKLLLFLYPKLKNFFCPSCFCCSSLSLFSFIITKTPQSNICDAKIRR